MREVLQVTPISRLRNKEAEDEEELNSKKAISGQTFYSDYSNTTLTEVFLFMSTCDSV